MTIEIRTNKGVEEYSPLFKFTSTDKIGYYVEYLGGDTFKIVKRTYLYATHQDTIAFLGSTSFFNVIITE
jgi:hypothetical protein